MVLQHRPIPPFTQSTALAKVQLAEDAWNTRDPEQITLLCSPDCIWRSRTDSFQGRAAIQYFLIKKWALETEYRLMKELWAYTGNRISVRFECEWKHAKGAQWYRRHGNEHWEFDSNGYMTRRDVSANDSPVPIAERRLTPTNP